MKQPVGLLSGGQRQALTLLMATLVTPKLLLLDEHTAALDPGTAETVLELTKKIVAEHGITCLMITHNLASSLALGNRTIMMAKKIRMCMPRDWNAAALRKGLHGGVTASVPCSLFQNHPDAMIVSIDRERGFEVELNVGVDIYFDKNGNFNRYDY